MASNNPPGIIRAFAAASIPEGYLLCDGASYLRADYPSLFLAIGTTFGSVDGTHFNVPDGSGRRLAGYDSGDASFDVIGETGGVKTINIQHSHTGNPHTHTASGTTSGPSGSVVTGSDNNTTLSTSGHTHSWSYTTGTQTATGSDSQLSTTQDIMNPYMALNWIIKI